MFNFQMCMYFPELNTTPRNISYKQAVSSKVLFIFAVDRKSHSRVNAYTLKYTFPSN